MKIASRVGYFACDGHITVTLTVFPINSKSSHSEIPMPSEDSEFKLAVVPTKAAH